MPKPTPAPKTPALVRGGALAIAFGVGMHGLACGGTELESQGGSASSEAGDGSDAEPDAITPQPLPTPDADVDVTIFLPATDAEADAITFLPDSGSHDAQADHVILLPTPPR